MFIDQVEHPKPDSFALFISYGLGYHTMIDFVQNVMKLFKI